MRTCSSRSAIASDGRLKPAWRARARARGQAYAAGMRAFLPPILLLCAATFVAGCQAPAPDPPATASTPASSEPAAPAESVAPVAPIAPAAPATAAAPAPAPTSTAATPQPGEPEPLATLPTAEADTCGAAEYSVWLGQEHQRLPEAPAGKVVRVVCSTCPMTMDFSAERLNVIYDEKTKLVTRLSCG